MEHLSVHRRTKRSAAMTSPTASVFVLRGNLSLGQLLNRCPWFVHAKAETDATRLGWRHVGPTEWPDVSASRLIGFSAEAACALAAMRGAFPSSGGRPLTRTVSEDAITGWERVLNSLWPDKGCWQVLSSGGVSALVREVAVDTSDAVDAAARSLTDDLMQVPISEVRSIRRLRDVLRRVITEALLNVYEHAYGATVARRAWVCATIFPARLLRQAFSSDAIFHATERAWLSALSEQHVVEVAIADSGIGIPCSLAPSAMSLLPRMAQAMRAAAAGSERFGAIRRQMHADLCDHAFRHYSTRKKDNEFTTPFHRLNWRGLYRCYRQVVELRGLITLISGHGKAGYAGTSHGAERIVWPLDTKADVPGTIVTVRIPLPPYDDQEQEPRNPPPGAALDVSTVDPPLTWQRIKDGQFSHGSEGVSDSAAKTQIVCLPVPFIEFARDGDPPGGGHRSSVELRAALERVPQKVVPIVCFAEMPDEWREEIRKFIPTSQWRPAVDGPPRLIGWLKEEGRVQWGMAGAVPESAEGAVRALETTGKWLAGVKPDTSSMRLFRELQAHYPEIVTWDRSGSVFSLVLQGTRLPANHHEAAFAAAFDQYWADEDARQGVVSEQKDRLILLPTGTRVRRHFSVFRLLTQSPLLASCLGQILVCKLRGMATASDITIVVDQPASRYIVHALLATGSSRYEVVSVDDLDRRGGLPRPVCVFTDAVFHGRTVARTIEEIRRHNFSVAAVIACVDLRPDPSTNRLSDVPLVHLVRPPGFQAEEVNTPVTTDDVPIDVLTHTPLGTAVSEFSELSQDQLRRDVLNAHPELYRIGFHVREGRTHTISLPLRGMIDLCGAREVARWFYSTVGALLPGLVGESGQRDTVMFSQYDARVNDLASLVAGGLQHMQCKGGRLFSVRMPVGHSGASSIYPPALSNPLAGCTEILSGRLSFGCSRLPDAGYVAIYIADAAVTGNALREFLHRIATAAEPPPAAVVAVVAVNRLSPGEVRFFRLCKHLVGTGGLKLPFAYDYLFNLQVGSRSGDGPINHTVTDRIMAEPILAVGELREYLMELRRRLTDSSGSSTIRHVMSPSLTMRAISIDAIRFRHLMALHQQNEPVVHEVLRLLEQMTSAKSPDPSLLSVLAIEPALLVVAPLRQFGHKLLTELAIRTLQDSEASPEVRSDALVILASYNHAIRDSFDRIATHVLKNRELRMQLASHLLDHELHGRESGASILDSFIAASEGRERTEASRLRDLLYVCGHINQASRKATRDDEARRCVERMISQMLHHSAGMEHEWDAVGTQLSNLAVYWRTIASSKKRAATLQTAQRGVEFAEQTIFPGLVALAQCARSSGAAHIAQEVDESFHIALPLFQSFEKRLAKCAGGMTMEDAVELNRQFHGLRESTWLAPSSNELLCGMGAPRNCGPLPRVLPLLFSMPTGVLYSVSNEVFARPTRLQEVCSQHLKHPLGVAIVCQVPVDSLRHIFSLLLDNVNRCGDIETLEVDVGSHQEIANRGGAWELVIRNGIVDSRRGSGGSGIAEATRTGSAFGVEIQSVADDGTGKWVTRVVIPGCSTVQRMSRSRT